MSDILARLRAAHAKTEMVRVSVPEYGMEMYFPPLTVSGQSAIRKGVSKNDEAGLFVNALIHQAHDAEGNRIFDVPVKDKPALMAELHRMPFEVLMRIVVESSGDLSADLAAEIVAIDKAEVRAALSAVSADHEGLQAAIAEASDDVLTAALTGIAEALDAGKSVKNA